MRRRASPGPSRQVLWGLVLAVLLIHVWLLWGGVSPLMLRLPALSGAPAVHLRLLSPPPAPPPVPAPTVKRSVPRVVLAHAAPLETPTDPAAVALPSASASEPLATAPADQAASPPLPESAPPASAPGAAPATEQGVASGPVPPSQEMLTPWPTVSLGALPESRVLNYQLTGLDKGLTYHASGELRWQHNLQDYELTLSVRAFLIGRRQWRSVGSIEASGLAPQRFSDSWRQERAAHFDRQQQRIVFSSTSTPAALEPGAQDQISLYVQLAAAMAGAVEPFAPGTRLQVQTATVRDAQPWSLTLEGGDRLSIDGQELPVLKWVCQPRNRFEARVEFWVAATTSWLPLRIRITQSNGSYIDLTYRSSEPLPPLPVRGDAKANATPS